MEPPRAMVKTFWNWSDRCSNAHLRYRCANIADTREPMCEPGFWKCANWGPHFYEFGLANVLYLREVVLIYLYEARRSNLDFFRFLWLAWAYKKNVLTCLVTKPIPKVSAYRRFSVKPLWVWFGKRFILVWGGTNIPLRGAKVKFGIF